MNFQLQDVLVETRCLVFPLLQRANANSWNNGRWWNAQWEKEFCFVSLFVLRLLKSGPHQWATRVRSYLWIKEVKNATSKPKLLAGILFLLNGCTFFFLFFFFLSFCLSPWCNQTGWLGVKHQGTYFFLSCFSRTFSLFYLALFAHIRVAVDVPKRFYFIYFYLFFPSLFPFPFQSSGFISRHDAACSL